MEIIESNPPISPRISILVPVYNTSKYLKECLDSLVTQTFKNIEIICLNDGSTDNSLNIIMDYQARDKRIRVVDKKNQGYGSTMNLGIELAKGEYIGIVESDDFVDRNMYKKLYKFATRNNCDLVKCNYYEYSQHKDVKQKPFNDFKYKTVFDPREEKWVMCVLPIIWAALYRRSMIQKNDIKFNESPGASFQDTSFVFQCWASARRAAILPSCLLHYRVDNTNSSVKSSSKVFAVCDEYALSQSFLEKDPEKMVAFGELIQLLKLGTYRWNYERIDGLSKKDFARRMSEEYQEADRDGLLNRAFFNDQDWNIIRNLISNPDDFIKKHPESF